MRKQTIIVLGLVLVTLIWYLAADRLTPFTTNARVKAIITPLVSEVSGKVVQIAVANGTIVKAGTLLAKIDTNAFEIARDKAQAELEQALQNVGAGSASVAAAQAKVSMAMADLENVRVQSERVFQLERKGVVAKADGDNARTQLSEAESSLTGARAELKRSEQELGPAGKDNAGIKRAMTELAKAELDLRRTSIVAPARGGITDLVVAPGAYAAAGKPLLTFVDIGQIWVEAYLTENNLGNVHVDDVVEVTLDIHPGRVFRGKVASISGATADETDTTPGTLTSAPKKSGWLRDPKRIPVRILLSGYEVGNAKDDVRFQINGQADVIVYTGKHPLLNLLGKAMIRIAAILSYAY